MTNINSTSASLGVAPSQEERLRGVVKQLEGVFVEQLFKAMRQTVPDDGLTHGGAGEDMFAGMLDQHLAGATPAQWAHGIGDSMFAQLRPALARSAAPSQDGEASSAKAATP